MIKTFFAQKLRMTAVNTPDGERVGGTILLVPEQKVLDNRTKDKHGYTAVRVQITKLPKSNKQKIREVRTGEIVEPGTEVKFEELVKVGDKVSVQGISKGKGFAGGVKRYHFKGGPRTHGQSDRERAPGSIGSTTTPGRVYKGKKMAGHMGVDTVTIRNLKVLATDAEKKQVVVGGSVPGANKYGLVKVAVWKKN
jgi:large subunit ribosomal protein L3